MKIRALMLVMVSVSLLTLSLSSCGQAGGGGGGNAIGNNQFAAVIDMPVARTEVDGKLKKLEKVEDIYTVSDLQDLQDDKPDSLLVVSKKQMTIKLSGMNADQISGLTYVVGNTNEPFPKTVSQQISLSVGKTETIVYLQDRKNYTVFYNNMVLCNFTTIFE